MRDDLTFDTHYGYWYNLACERFYSRIDFALSFVQLVGGSGAALGVVSGSPNWVAASGVALACCAATSLLVQPAVKAERHCRTKCEFLAIKGRLHQMGDDDLCAEVARVQSAGPAGLGALAKPAYNSTLYATGRESGVKRLNPVEWVAALVS